MKNVFNILIMSMLFVFASVNGYAQITDNDIGFPDDWLGTYKGKMYVLRQGKGVVDSIDVKFELLATNLPNQWIYRMTYNNLRFKNIVKDYLLVKPDSLAAGTYLLDEKDGIIIQQTLLGNTFYSSFTVAGSYLNSIMRKTGNIIDFEIFSFSEKESLTSQNEAKEAEQVYVVKSFPPFTTQWVKLKKEN